MNNHERNTMPTPVNTTITSSQGDYILEVSMSTESPVSPGSVAEHQLDRVAKAMRILMGTSWRDESDDEERD